MPSTRSTTRKAQKLSPQAGNKRKAETRGLQGTPVTKAAKKNGATEQKKLEDMGFEAGHDTKKDVENGNDAAEETEHDTKDAGKDGHDVKNGANPIHKSSKRKAELPSNIIEKGIVYFLTRGRVDTPSPHKISDLQRSYIVLRPLPLDAKLGDGPIPDSKTARLIAIPKKTLPTSGRERFMAIVEKCNVSMADLKVQVFQGKEYETQTLGTRETPPVAPVGEGVYAITLTGRTSHLAYVLAIPAELGQVQKDMGIRSKGSLVLSLKNPAKEGLGYAQLGENPDFPDSVLEEFGELRWMAIQKPEHLDYPNSQILLVGEGQDNFKGALEPDEEDQKSGEKKTPAQELEELVGEEELRIEHLNGM